MLECGNVQWVNELSAMRFILVIHAWMWWWAELMIQCDKIYFRQACLNVITCSELINLMSQDLLELSMLECSVFKISAGLRTLTSKIWVGPASFPSLSYISFCKIVLRSGLILKAECGDEQWVNEFNVTRFIWVKHAWMWWCSLSWWTLCGKS